MHQHQDTYATHTAKEHSAVAAHFALLRLCSNKRKEVLCSCWFNESLARARSAARMALRVCRFWSRAVDSFRFVVSVLRIGGRFGGGSRAAWSSELADGAGVRLLLGVLAFVGGRDVISDSSLMER